MNKDSQIPLDDKAFDKFLASQLRDSQPYLADDNFTAQVMGKLPAPKKLSRWQERLIMLVPTVVIGLLVMSQFSLLDIVIKIWTLLITLDVVSLLAVGSIISLGVISGASYWYARQFKII